jgi:hypothetical protein
MKTLALAVALALASVTASATTVSITDFTAGTIAPFGSAWQWDSPSRDLGVYGSNTNSDYLYQTYGALDRKNIAGTTALELTAQWTPAGGGNPPDGHFFIDLINNGTLLARANYTYGQFVSGTVTVSAPLAWEPSVPTTFMDQWQLVGNGNSQAAFGDFTLTNMVAVPEPATYAAALGGLACGGFSMWRRRKRA